MQMFYRLLADRRKPSPCSRKRREVGTKHVDFWGDIFGDERVQPAPKLVQPFCVLIQPGQNILIQWSFLAGAILDGPKDPH